MILKNILASLTIIILPNVYCMNNAQPFNKFALIENLKDAQRLLKKSHVSMQQFSSPTTVQGAWEHLKLVTSYLKNEGSSEIVVSNLFVNQYKSAPLFQKRLVCEILYDCVDTLDTAIKTVKSSPNIDQSTKFLYVPTMITEFFEVFKSWAIFLMPERAITYHQNWSLRKYISRVEYILENKLKQLITDDELKKSASFSVQAAILGSVTAFERHYPNTLEDIFMLIHQNSLTVIAAIFNDLLGTQSLDQVIAIPPIAKALMEKLEDSSFGSYSYQLGIGRLKPQRLGVRTTAHTTEILYNMPLRNHSSTMQIVINKATNQCTLSVQFIGEARKRWEQILVFAALSPELSGLPLKDRIICDTNSGVVSFNWIIQNDVQIRLAESYLVGMAYVSYENDILRRHLEEVNLTNANINKCLDNVANQYGHFKIINILQR